LPFRTSQRLRKPVKQHAPIGKTCEFVYHGHVLQLGFGGELRELAFIELLQHLVEADDNLCYVFAAANRHPRVKALIARNSSH